MSWINKSFAKLLPYFPKQFIWIFSKRYIAGESLEDAIRVSKELNRQGISVTLDLLGEFQTNESRIEEYKRTYLNTIDEAVKQNVDCTFSIKPTMFGLFLDYEKCYNTIKDIIIQASGYNRLVTIDMEDSNCTDMEIILFRRLHKEFPAHVGFVLQAYLKRTPDDLKDLVDINSDKHPLNIRICKGIYVEPAEIAFKKHLEINKNYMVCLDYMIEKKYYPCIATHDKHLVKEAFKRIEKTGTTKKDFEFQMLYGVTPRLRNKIVEAGHTMRVYVPYGKDWFNYSTRRLQENPRMAIEIIKALFIRK
ncbi:MAG: proline dehydrogenase family protein [Bacteroidales bacterium]|nr:proline dehydrogenase family protein [Bacteroidales bacterium]